MQKINKNYGYEFSANILWIISQIQKKREIMIELRRDLDSLTSTYTEVCLNLTSCCTEWAALQGFCYRLLCEEIPAKSHFVSLSATKKLADVRMEDKL